jgi:hypothetical protein
MWMFFDIGRLFKYVYAALEYVIDSFPVKVCHNIRISRSRILKGEVWRGKNVSKREYFYGVKVQLLTTQQGVPVEMCFVPGSEHDVDALRKMSFDLPPESTVYGDSAYTHYEMEDLYKETEMISLKIGRRKNSKRADESWQSFIKTAMRKRIETSISEIIELTPQSIHAVTQKGFLIKILLFVMAYQFKFVL